MEHLPGYDAWKLQGPPEGPEDDDAEDRIGQRLYFDDLDEIGVVESYSVERDDDEDGPYDVVMFSVRFASGAIEMTESELQEATVVDGH